LRSRARDPAGWDELEQLALALAALDADGQPHEATRALLRKLAFPKGRAGPVGFRRDARFDEELKDLFGRLRAGR
jgi:hypothetical protein